MPASNTDAQRAYQIAPIILTGGIASGIPHAMLPIQNLMYPGGSALSFNPDMKNLDDAFAAFNVVPGGQLILQQIGKYPFANQYVAANAVIREPLTLSVLMDTPMRGKNSWEIKKQVFTALKQTLEQHNNKGGTYTVATPAFTYENLIMTALTDISRAANTVPQNAWRFDFEQPLFTAGGMLGALNNTTSMITQGLKTTGNMTGIKTGSQTAQPSQMKGTFKVVGALAGGPPSISVDSPTSRNAFNYPASAPSAGFGFGGIS